MDLDVDCLREARIENVERLGRALGVKLPDKKRLNRRSYSREVVRVVMLALRRDALEARRRERHS